MASETQGGRTTSYTCDALGRRLSTQGPGNTAPTGTTYDNNTGREVVTTRGLARTRTVLDGLGRPIRTETGDTGGYHAKTSTAYDAEGRVSFRGHPVDINATDVGVQVAYDAVGRVIAETNPDSTVRTREYPTATTIVVRDEENRASTITRRMIDHPADGRIVQLSDAASQAWHYEYDVMGRLESAAGPGGVTRLWTYTSGSKLLESEFHPESGTVQYTHYYPDGLLQRKVDANGTEFLYAYDGNNRLTQITSNPASGPAQVTTFTYVPGSDRRATATVDDVSTAFTYDATGRLAVRTDTVDGLPFIVLYEYDTLDNLTTITYPSGRQVGYAYDTQHRIARVFNVVTDATYADQFTYHPSGALASYRAGNGVTTTLTYDPHRLWLDTVQVGAGGSVLSLDYGYDDVGNITGIVDGRSGMSQTFAYDVLDRLTHADGFYGPLTYT